jgi:hypothetical protein
VGVASSGDSLIISKGTLMGFTIANDTFFDEIEGGEVARFTLTYVTLKSMKGDGPIF